MARCSSLRGLWLVVAVIRLECLLERGQNHRHILCTHIHMDHAGGAGYLAEALPRAAVYINSAVAEHLADPARLMASVRRAVGEEVWPLHGEAPVELDLLDVTDRPIHWTADQLIYVRESGDLALSVYRLDMVTGKSDLLTALVPSDLSGVVAVGGGRGQVAATPDGKGFVYTYWTYLRDLFLVEGLPR